jgi:Fe-S-cluster-containing dehydrogenase component
MTSLPAASPKKLGLVIDLDVCVGCHACAVACKLWNEQGQFGPLPDEDPYGREPLGVWFNRVHSYEVERGPEQPAMTVHFPRSCLHCETPACVTVCPTGASYKRAEDGIVLVDEAKCIGCKLCSWACPYGAREYSETRGVMQKCTLCVDRIYNERFAPEDREPACVQACPTRARHFGDLGDARSPVSRLVAERSGYDLMPELGYRPVNKYLPPRPRREGSPSEGGAARDEPFDPQALPPLLRWLDRVLSR